MPVFRKILLLLSLLASFAVVSGGQSIPLSNESRFQINGRTATISKVDTLPFVDSEYSRLFKFDSADNPKLKELRDRYKLDEVIASTTNEFDQQVLLMDWVHNRFRKFGQPTKQTRGALDILQGIDHGETFFCTQYAQLLASAAASLGWIDRVLALRRHSDAGHQGSTEHSTTEIWSNQFRKWIMLDPTSNMYLERDGVPLNAFEIRQEWFYNSGTNLTFVIGKVGKRYRKSDLPIFLRAFPGFGDLTIDPYELDKYGFIGYIPNTDLMDSGFNYGEMFIIRDQLCDGTRWHKRKLPENPALDPYFPINQAAIALRNEGESLSIHIRTFTPNFKAIEVQIDHSDWQTKDPQFSWEPHVGANILRVRTRNEFNLPGPISEIVIEVTH